MITADLIALQKRARLTQGEFCRVLGISPSKFANIIGTRTSFSIGNRELPTEAAIAADALVRYLDVIGTRP